MTIGYPTERDGFIFGNIPFVPATREPCPVCGHPTSDCSNGQRIAPKEIVGVETFPSLHKTTKVVVEEDIYEMRQITPFTNVKVLVARAGQQVTVEQAKELGLL